jgi:hypothetical protein
MYKIENKAYLYNRHRLFWSLWLLSTHLSKNFKSGIIWVNTRSRRRNIMDTRNEDKDEYADITSAAALSYCADIEDAPFYETFYKNLQVPISFHNLNNLP